MIMPIADITRVIRFVSEKYGSIIPVMGFLAKVVHFAANSGRGLSFKRLQKNSEQNLTSVEHVCLQNMVNIMCEYI